MVGLRLTQPTAPAHRSTSSRAPFRRYRDGILAAIRLGLSNSRIKALNSKVRLLSHRSFGFHSPEPLIALIYLSCTGLPPRLPLR